MGKGVIKSGGTAGLYTIDVSRDTTAMDAWKAKLEQRLLDIADEITAADVVVADAKADLDSAVVLMNSLIDVWEESQDNDEAINTQAKVVAEKGKNYRVAKQKRDALVLDQVSIQKQIEAIEDVDALIEAVAWCADYTEDLSGDVGTVEIPGDRTRLLIRPGDDGAATYSLARDGQLQPTQSSTAATVAWNYTMFPGWQKWIPQYRSATITSIDTGANTCTITFGAETSTAQGLDVNYITASSDIPISYMTCDHEAFEIGDMVLVEFENVTTTGTVDNWANPKVIGFIDNPKECPVLIGYRVQPNPGCETADAEECWNGWGAPFDDGGEPPVLINPPWGTAQSGSRNQSLLINQGGWKHWRDPQTQTWNSASGTIDWQGNNMLIGWYGGEQGSRYRIHDFGYNYFYRGTSYSPGYAVIGACIRVFNNEKVILIATDSQFFTRVSTFKEDGTLYGFDDDSAGAYDLAPANNTGSFWLFNAAGTEAVQTREFSGDDPTHSACHITSPVWRRKMRLTVSLSVGGGGAILPTVTITDLGDEMPVFVEPTANYDFHTAALGVVGSIWRCTEFGTGYILSIQGLLEDEYWDRDNSLSFSYKFYDYKGNVETSAEFWNTRVWRANHTESPAPVTTGLTGHLCRVDDTPEEERTGTNEDSLGFVTQEFPVECSGSSELACGVRFTGGVGGDVQYTATESYTGTGTSASGITGGYFENRPGFGNTLNTLTVSNFTHMSLAVPYMDMRFGQLITIFEKRIRDYSDEHYFDYAEPQNEYYEQSGNITTNLTITIYANGAIIDTETREDIEALVPEEPPFHQFNPYLRLAENIHRKCRGYHGTAVRPDYLFQGPQKDPRPMASAGGSSYCLSYVDRWVKDDESDAPNEHVPPIRSVMNNFPVALNIPGTWPNAAPVTPVEASS